MQLRGFKPGVINRCAVNLRSARRVGAGNCPGYARPPNLCNNSYVWRIQMPKLKTKSSVKKRFRLTATGKVRSGFAFKRHNLRKRSQKMKRKARGTVMLSEADSRIVKSYMPYA